MVYLVGALLLVGLDQWAKWLVIKSMAIGDSFPVISNIFYLTYVRNPGAAFSMLPYRTTFFIAISSIVVIGITGYILWAPKEERLLKTGLACILGGATGNLIDRLRFGSVIDFFDFRVWPVFNIADIAICIGVAILVFELMRPVTKSQPDSQ